jgi:hypothetical protein
MRWDVLRLAWADALLDLRSTKCYFQSAVVFSALGIVLESLYDNLGTATLWCLFFFDLFFAILMFLLSVLSGLRKFNYILPGAFFVSKGNQPENTVYGVWYSGSRKDKILTFTLDKIFYAWLILTLTFFFVT